MESGASANHPGAHGSHVNDDDAVSTCPGSHAHRVLPSAGDEFIGHSSQTAAFSLAENVSAGHVTHSVLFTPLCVPAGHATHALASSDAASGFWVPAGQSTQEAFPVLSWYVPGSHDSHRVRPASDANVPGTHGAHVPDPSASFALPCGHASQTSRPTTPWNVPATQSCDRINKKWCLSCHSNRPYVNKRERRTVHDVEPVSPAKDPAGHDSHDAAPSPEKDPGSHSTHRVVPSTGVYVPAAHASHTLDPLALTN